jgi:hypothetical protein
MFMIAIMNRCAELPDYDDTVRDNVPPGQVRVTDTTSLPGGAIIRYSLPPEDTDVLGVITRYSRREGGEIIETYTSAFADSTLVEGFADTTARIVRLITVDKSNNRSEPLEVRVKPGTAPIELVRRSLVVTAGFGGVVVAWKNHTRSNIGIYLYSESDSTGLATDMNYYSGAEDGIYIFGEFAHHPWNFRIQIKDRWNNYSVPLDTVLTPLEKTKIPARDATGFLWKRHGFADGSSLWRGDFSRNGGQNYFENMFNENYADFWGGGVENTPSIYIAGSGTEKTVPLYFTIDLGRSYVICQHRLWHDQNNELGGQNLRAYELWATNETPKGGPSDFATQQESLAYWTSWSVFNGTDAWKSEGGWIKIADCETLPYSGSTAPTDADKTHAKENGFTFDIYPEYTGTPFRYIRVAVVRSLWNGNTNPRIAEFELFGSVATEESE